MDAPLISTIAMSISTSASTAGVAIVALMLNNKRFDTMDKRFDRLEDKLEKLDASIDMLDGTTKELDKRLSIIEDRMIRS